MRFAMEIEALGTNTLAEVADTIECVSNMGLFKEVENPKVDFKGLRDAKVWYNNLLFHTSNYPPSILQL